MKKIFLTIVLLGLSTLSAFVSAGYFSGELLLGKVKQDVDLDVINIDSDDTSLGIRGAYNFTKNVGLELSYIYYPDVEYTISNVKGTFSTAAVNFGVKGSIPLGNVVSLYGRTGISSGYMKDDSNSMTDDGFGGGVYIGLGAQFNINKKVFIGAEYTIFNFSAELDGDSPSSHDVENKIKVIAMTVGMNF